MHRNANNRMCSGKCVENKWIFLPVEKPGKLPQVLEMVTKVQIM